MEAPENTYLFLRNINSHTVKRGCLYMNKQRAMEIVNSPDMAHVSYEGVPVYIQNVDEDTEMARIFPLGQTENEQNVPLNSLKEY